MQAAVRFLLFSLAVVLWFTGQVHAHVVRSAVVELPVSSPRQFVVESTYRIEKVHLTLETLTGLLCDNQPVGNSDPIGLQPLPTLPDPTNILIFGVSGGNADDAMQAYREEIHNREAAVRMASGITSYQDHLVMFDGDSFAAANAAWNFAYLFMRGFTEAGGGMGLQPGNLGRELTRGQRIWSGVEGGLGTLGTAGAGLTLGTGTMRSVSWTIRQSRVVDGPLLPAALERGTVGSHLRLPAAKRGGQLVPMAENLYANGSVRNVAGFEIWGNAGKVGSSYNVNVLGLYQAEGAATKGYLALSNALKAEARAAGASQLNITGNAIINPGLMNLPSPVLQRLGFTLRTINEDTIFLTAPIK